MLQAGELSKIRDVVSLQHGDRIAPDLSKLNSSLGSGSFSSMDDSRMQHKPRPPDRHASEDRFTLTMCALRPSPDLASLIRNRNSVAKGLGVPGGWV